MGEPVRIIEVGPRDGLQNEAAFVPTEDKIALVERLMAARPAMIEVTSFVSPAWVPQMADAADVLAGIRRAGDVGVMALTPNLRGYEAALAAGVDRVAVFAAASESFSRKNINCSIEESFARFAPIFEANRAHGLGVRGYISCVTHCPFEGQVAPEAVAAVAARFAATEVADISLGETLGRARPEDVDAMLRAVTGEVPPARLAAHFHDTDGRALENIDVALSHGIRVVDAAVGGLGGCPYAPGAAGNVATEAVVAHLERAGFETGMDKSALAEAAALARGMRT